MLSIPEVLGVSLFQLQEKFVENGAKIDNKEPSLDEFAESLDLLFSHR